MTFEQIILNFIPRHDGARYWRHPTKRITILVKYPIKYRHVEYMVYRGDWWDEQERSWRRAYRKNFVPLMLAKISSTKG